MDGSYEDPLSRHEGPFTFEIPAGYVDDPHAIALLALHSLDATMAHTIDAMALDPSTLQTALSANTLRRETTLASDADFLRRFPTSPALTPDQTHRLHDRLLWYRHHRNVWSEDDWDIGTAPLDHDITLKPGTKPVKLRPYRVNAIKQDMMHLFLSQLV
jgi:hypothetical protein